jgi:hypothetical protein
LTCKHDPVELRDARCHLLGDLAARAMEEQQPDLQQWAEIDRALGGGPGFSRQRRRWALVFGFPALAVLGLAFAIASRLTLGHALHDCSLASEGSLSVPDSRVGIVAFDDGTHISLGQATRGNLHTLGFRRGAQLTLDRGHADLSVVHRWMGRWEVKAGPFAVLVTGTQFEVDWAPGDSRFGLHVRQGEVDVTGCPQRAHMRVHAGQRLDANGTTVCVMTDIPDATVRLLATALPVQTALAEAVEKNVTEKSAVHQGSEARAERKKVSPGSRTHNVSLVASREPPGTRTENTAMMPEAAFRNWSSSFVADEGLSPGQGQATIGEKSNFSGENPGFVRAFGGAGTTFFSPADGAPGHLSRNDGLLCTRGRIAAIACRDIEDQPRKCNWDTNWGVHMEWYPRVDRKAWGSRAPSGIAFEFQGKPGMYQLVAHRHDDPSDKWYCVQDYRSGRTVTPSHFYSSCRSSGGSTLPDFTKVDQFALQVASQDDPVTFRICLSSITLY